MLYPHNYAFLYTFADAAALHATLLGGAALKHPCCCNPLLLLLHPCALVCCIAHCNTDCDQASLDVKLT
jgi:hypothetical protein